MRLLIHGGTGMGSAAMAVELILNRVPPCAQCYLIQFLPSSHIRTCIQLWNCLVLAFRNSARPMRGYRYPCPLHGDLLAVSRTQC
jgi:hypothetical protein